MRASQAADWLDISLRSSMSPLEGDIVRYNQSAGVGMGHIAPVNLDLHAGEFHAGLRQGDDIDLHLVRVAAAFYNVGHPVMGPLPSDIIGWPYVADDAAIGAEVDRWDQELGMQFRQGESGMEVRGPDGNWYRIVDRPPLGVPSLGSTQETVDLGNPEFGFTLSAAIIYGLLGGGSTHHGYGSMPPGAYDNIRFDENGHIVMGPEVGETGPPPMHPPAQDGAGDPPPGVIVPDRGGGWSNIQGALAAATEHANHQHDGIHHMQTTYYIDPETGERVAVVNAAKMFYGQDELGRDEIVIREGRLSFDGNGMVRAVAPTGLVLLLLVLCAVAIGGVVHGNRVVGPLTAAVGAGAAQLLAHSAVLRAWESSDQQLLVASVLGVCLLASHGLHRLIGYRPVGAAPPAAWGPPMGGPAAAPWPAMGSPPAPPPPPPPSRRPEGAG